MIGSKLVKILIAFGGVLTCELFKTKDTILKSNSSKFKFCIHSYKKLSFILIQEIVLEQK